MGGARQEGLEDQQVQSTLQKFDSSRHSR
jgi:hypothetical protein